MLNKADLADQTMKKVCSFVCICSVELVWQAVQSRLLADGETTVLYTVSNTASPGDKHKVGVACSLGVTVPAARHGASGCSQQHCKRSLGRLSRRQRVRTDGIRVLIAGMPNVGKSSLINALRCVHLRQGTASCCLARVLIVCHPVLIRCCQLPD